MVRVDELLLGMNDGNGKEASGSISSDMEDRQPRNKMKNSAADEFANAIARIAVAQVCEGLGFQSFHQSALETLANVGVRYIEEIGKRAVSCSNIGNRSECNIFDAIQGLEDMCSVQGFPSASDSSPSVLGSGVVKDLIRYVGESEEIPFAYSIPNFPFIRERRANVSFAQGGFGTPDEHIPNWLPMFPLEGGLQQSVPEVDVKPTEPMDGLKEQSPPRKNPFLAPPLPFGEKEISLPIFQEKHLGEGSRGHQRWDDVENEPSHSQSVMPVQDAAAEGIPNGQEGKRNGLLQGRQNVLFKFRNHKKSVRSCMSPFNETIEKTTDWFRDNEDEKNCEETNDRICADKLECLQEAAQL